jgi:cytochrome c oxidase subunit I
MSTVEITANPTIDSHTHHDEHGHHDHHHKQSFISKYIFSTDHKMISKQYLITGIIMGCFGMGMSLLFRMQLAWPDETFPLFESLLGKWGKGGKLDPKLLHGIELPFTELSWCFMY